MPLLSAKELQIRKEDLFPAFCEIDSAGTPVTVNGKWGFRAAGPSPDSGPGPPTSSWKPARSQPRDLAVENFGGIASMDGFPSLFQ